jgi:hypothetical protein
MVPFDVWVAETASLVGVSVEELLVRAKEEPEGCWCAGDEPEEYALYFKNKVSKPKIEPRVTKSNQDARPTQKGKRSKGR